MKKKFIIIGAILFIVVAILITIFLINRKSEKKEIMYLNAMMDENVSISDDLSLEYGRIAYLKDYITVSDGKLNDVEILYDKLGEQKIKFSYKNELGENYRYIKINVVDTTEPYVSVPSYKTVLVNSSDEFIYDFFCADNYDRNVTRSLVGDYDLSTEGTYKVVYKAEDSSGNITEKNLTINVVEQLPKAQTKKSEPINYIEYIDLYNKYKNENTLVGIDISRWQGEVDFDLLKENNVEFIMIRLGGQDGVDGEYYLDSKFERNIEEATKRGFKIGVYFYSYAYTEKEAIKQAKYVIKNLKNYKLDLPIVFDWECWNKFNKLGISLFDITKVQDAFLNYVESKGFKSSRYGSKNYLINAWQDSRHLTWLAHYIPETNYEGEYFMWQRCDTGRVPGINGAVDVDILYLDKYNF